VEVSLCPEEQPPKAHKVTFTVPFKPEECDGEETDDSDDGDDGDDGDDSDDSDDSEDNDDGDGGDEAEVDKEITAQKVQLYDSDMKEDFSDEFQENVINKDQKYELTLAIEEGKTAKYKVVRDGEVILKRKVAYGEAE